MIDLYFKRPQQDGSWHYFKLHGDRFPPALEVLNFLNTRPVLDFHEFDLGDPSSRIEYKGLFDEAVPIEVSEYKQAYRRATNDRFDLCINGRKLQD